MPRKAGYSKYTDEDIEAIARGTSRIILAALGGRDASLLPSWRHAARELGAGLYRYIAKQGDGPGYYDPFTKSIFYSHNAPHWDRIRTIAHEMAHHVQVVCPRGMHHATRIQRYDDNRNSVQHRVAVRVEIILLGEPESVEDRLAREQAEQKREEEIERAEAQEEKEWREKNGYPVIGRAGYKFF